MRIFDESRWLLIALACAACSADKVGDGRTGLNGMSPLTGSGSNVIGGAGAGTGISTGSNPGAAQSFGNPNQAAAPTTTNRAPMACAAVTLEANRVTPTVMLLVDGSSSMETGYPDENAGMGMNGMNATGTGGMTAAGGRGAAGGGTAGAGGASSGTPSTALQQTTRWNAVREALVNPTNGVVPKLQKLVKFGLAVFGTTGSCPLPIGVVTPDLNNFPKIMSGMPPMEPGVYTPTGIALDQIVDMLPDPTGFVDKMPGPQIVVLATDGDPNACDIDPTALLLGGSVTDYGPSIAAALKLQKKHQKMYVIAVGNEAGRQHLQEMANIGANMPQMANPGAMVYYPDNPASLADTLQTLIGKEIPCDVELKGRGVRVGSECKGTVKLNGQMLECNGDNGWALTDMTHITLKGTTCDMFKNAQDAVLEANFPCDSLIM